MSQMSQGSGQSQQSAVRTIPSYVNHPIIVPTMAGQAASLPIEPVMMPCPKCFRFVMTSKHFTPGNLTWLVCILLCCCGLIFGCCLIPFWLECCLDVEHRCPNCNHSFGKYKRIGK